MTTEREKSEEQTSWSRRLASMQRQSREAYEKLDPGDIDAAIELGGDICKELGICCADKGRVMYRVFQKLQEQKTKEEAAKLAEEEGFPAVAEMLRQPSKIEEAAAPPAPAAEQPSGKLEVLKEKTEEGGEE